MTSCASQCDVTEFYKLSLTNSSHIVLATVGVCYDSRLVLEVLYKKITKLLTPPRMCIAQKYSPDVDLERFMLEYIKMR